MHCHAQVALGDLFLSHLMLGSRPRHNSPESDLIKANEDLLCRSDIALLSDESTHELQSLMAIVEAFELTLLQPGKEMNTYMLLVAAVYHAANGNRSRAMTNLAAVTATNETEKAGVKTVEDLVNGRGRLVGLVKKGNIASR